MTLLQPPLPKSFPILAASRLHQLPSRDARYVATATALLIFSIPPFSLKKPTATRTAQQFKNHQDKKSVYIYIGKRGAAATVPYRCEWRRDGGAGSGSCCSSVRKKSRYRHRCEGVSSGDAAAPVSKVITVLGRRRYSRQKPPYFHFLMM